MHEIGMLYETAKIAVQYAEQNQIDSIKGITMEVGEGSGVFPEIFTEYFPYVAAQYPQLKDAEMHIRIVPSEGLCTDCHCLYNIMKQKGICPRCHSRKKKVLSGRKVRIQDIEFESA